MLVPLNRAALRKCLEEGYEADGWALRLDGSADTSRALEAVVEALDLAEDRPNAVVHSPVLQSASCGARM